jgi:hypothetical protein
VVSVAAASAATSVAGEVSDAAASADAALRAAAPPPRRAARNGKRLAFEARRAAAWRKRREFLVTNAERLINKLGWCGAATKVVLAMNNHDLYDAHSPLHPPLVDVIKARRARLRGSRETRGLPPLDQLQNEVCCSAEHYLPDACGGDGTWCCCVRFVTLEASEGLWRKYALASTMADEADVLASAMWVRGTGRVLPFCANYYRLVTGASEGRVRLIRSLVAHYGEALHDAPELHHGATGRAAHNKTDAGIIARMERVIEMYTRRDPSDSLLQCCNGNFAGPTGLIQAMALEEPEAFLQIHESTAMRMIQT